MKQLFRTYAAITAPIDVLAQSVPALLLRLILAWEFGEAGYQKLIGSHWFGEIAFPFPFNLLSPTISWNMALAFELAGAVALVLGLATRFFSLSLLILTVVAIAAVHWPEQWSTLFDILKGYRIIDEQGDGYGNYKLPLLYIIMLIPLVLGGAGKLSVDNWIKQRLG